MSNHSQETALVTGGGGFLGKAIVKKLLARGTKVRTIARSDYPELKELGATHIRGSITDPKAVREALEGCDVVFHVAAKVGVWGKYEDFVATNIEGTRLLLNTAREVGANRFIYTSSPSVVFDGKDMEGANESVPYPAEDEYLTHYPKTKAAAERLVKQAGQEGMLTACLRPHLIWGPEDNHLVPRILGRAKQLRIIGEGNNVVDTVYVDNAADAHIQAADTLQDKPEISGRAYFITQDEPINAWEMINRILAAGGKPPIKKKISYKAAHRIGAFLEWIYGTFGISSEPRMTRFVAGELAKSHWFDISAARNDFGYDPQVSTDEGLKRLETWLKETDQYQQ